MFSDSLCPSYQWQLVPDRRKQLGVRVCQRLSHWRRCWTNHHLHQWFYPRAFVHRAGYRVPGSTIPSRRYQSGHQLGQHGLKYIHAWSKFPKTKDIKIVFLFSHRFPWRLRVTKESKHILKFRLCLTTVVCLLSHVSLLRLTDRVSELGWKVIYRERERERKRASV